MNDSKISDAQSVPEKEGERGKGIGERGKGIGERGKEVGYDKDIWLSGGL